MVPLARQRQSERHDVIGAKARIEREEVEKRSRQQAGADQQRDGQRNLGDHEGIADACTRSAGSCAPCRTQQYVQIRSTDGDERRGGEDQRGDQ